MARDEQQRREMGARIKELREANGLKQKAIADHCGVELRTYQMWQAGDVTPGQDNIEKLADLFHVTPKFLLRGETPEPLGAAMPEDAVAQLLAKLEAIEEQLQLLRAENEVRAMEVKQQIAQALEPTQETRRRRPA